MISRYPLLISLLALLLTACNNDTERYIEAVAAAEEGIKAVTLAPPALIMNRLETRQMTFRAELADGSTKDLSATAHWQSGDPQIAKVDSRGLVTAVADGSTWVRASFADFVAQSTITVSTADLTALMITGVDSVSVCRPAELGLSGSYSDGTTRDISTSTASWSVTPSSAGMIDANGQLVVTSDSVPAVSVTARVGAVSSASRDISVLQNLSRIDLSAPTLNIEIGSTTQFTAQGFYTDGGSADLTAYANWRSSAPTVAEASAGGAVKAVSVGSATIFASCGGVEGNALVTVLPQSEVVAIEIEDGSAEVSVNQGETLQLTVTAIDSLGRRTDVTDDATWSVDTVISGSVSVGNDKDNKGEVDTSQKGVAFIKAEYKNESDLIKVTIN